MKHSYDCVIVGGGPAGMAAAVALGKLGVRDILLLERNERLGGILNQCIHAGFGLSYFGETLTGPEYARALERDFALLGADCALGAMVLEIARSRIVKVMSRAEGYREIAAGAVIVATGCRERTRENLEIPGTRPAGVFTAGQAQNLVNLRGYAIGHRVLIQGSGDIGLIMARRLSIEGSEVVGVFERLPYLSGLVRNKVQCLDHFGIPLAFRSQVCEIAGRGRVEGAWVERLDKSLAPIPGTREFHACDAVLFSVGLIPEVDILKGAGLVAARAGTVEVNSHFEADGTGIFVCGNALHIHDLADNASREGEAVAAQVASYLRRPGDYAATATPQRPYEPLRPDTRHDEAFFERLTREKAEVCIVCPRGCVLSEGKAACPKGAAYFRETREGRNQVLTTSIRRSPAEGRGRLPLRSLEPVPIPDLRRVKIALAGAGRREGGTLALELDGREYRFAACP